MSGQSKLTRSLIAAVAALMMSSVTVVAAVGPAQAGSAQGEAVINA